MVVRQNNDDNNGAGTKNSSSLLHWLTTTNPPRRTVKKNQRSSGGYNPHAFSNSRVRASINRYTYENGQTSSTPTSSQKPVSSSKAPAAPAAPATSAASAAPAASVVSAPAPSVIQQDQNPAINCYPGDQAPTQGMGCWLTPSSQERFSRRFIDTLEGVPGADRGSGSSRNGAAIYTKPPPQQSPKSQALRGPSRSIMSPTWNAYDKTLYYNPVALSSERRNATGVIVNSHTGKLMETYEDDLPPPNVDREIAQESLQKTNPFLIWRQGGKDPNREPPNKKEICENLPRGDDGPNVWGDQLYADRRRAELQQRVMRDVWSHRDGDHSVQSVDDRRPVGYVGFQPAYRPIPYLPATQKASLDNKGYLPIPADQVPSGSSRDVIFPRISQRKPDLTLCPPRAFSPDVSPGTDFVEPQPRAGGGVIRLDGTNRATLETQAASLLGLPDGAAGGRSSNAYVVLDTNVRGSTGNKPDVTEAGFPVGSSSGLPASGTTDATGGHVVPDTNSVLQKGNRNKEAVAQTMFPSIGAMPACGGGGSGGNGGNGSIGPYVVLDTTLKDTLKQVMETMLPTTGASGSAALETGGAIYAMTQDEAFLRDSSLKEIMSSMFDTANVDPGSSAEYGGTGAGGLAFDPAEQRRFLRDTTQKEVMQQMFPSCNMVPDGGGGGTGSSSYVVIDKDVRKTLKTLGETMFAPGVNAFASEMLSNGPSGATYVDFQGDLLPTNRMHYEDVPSRPTAFGEVNGNPLPLQTYETDALEPFRGGDQLAEWFPGLSKVPASTEDNSTPRNLPEFGERQSPPTNRDQRNRLPIPTRRSLQEPRVINGGEEYTTMIGGDGGDGGGCGGEGGVVAELERRTFTPDYFTAGQAAGGI